MIKIGKFKYKIQDIDSLDSEELKLDGTKCYGTCNYETQTISIWSNATKERYNSTVLHELTHAFLESYGLSKDSYIEEDICNFIGLYGEELIDEARKYMR